MGDYIIFVGLGLVGAIAAAVKIWHNSGSDTIILPVETVEGNFALPKPSNKEHLEGVAYDTVSLTINPINNANSNSNSSGGSPSSSGGY